MANIIKQDSSKINANDYSIPAFENEDQQFHAGQALASLLKGTASGAVGYAGDIEESLDQLGALAQKKLKGRELTEEEAQLRKEQRPGLPTTADVEKFLGAKKENKYNKIATELGENFGSELAILGATTLATGGAGTVPVATGLALRKILKKVIPRGLLHSGVDIASDYANLPDWARASGHILASVFGDSAVRGIKSLRLSSDAKKYFKASTKGEAKIKIAEKIKNDAFKNYEDFADKTFLKDKQVRQLLNDEVINKALRSVEADPSLKAFSESVNNRINLLRPGSTARDFTDIQKLLNQKITRENLGKDLSLLNLKQALKNGADNIIFKGRPKLKNLFDRSNDLNVWFEDAKKIERAFSKLGSSDQNPIIDAIKRIPGIKQSTSLLKKRRVNRALSKKLAEVIKDNKFISSDLLSFGEHVLKDSPRYSFYFTKFKNNIENIDVDDKKKKKTNYAIKIKGYDD